MAKIQQIKAREILDSRGNPTIETTVVLDDDSLGIASVPSGASLGKYEAVEFRDNDSNRYGGVGVLKAVHNVNALLGPGLTGVDPQRQFEIDKWMTKIDGTPYKSKYGANAILSISLSICKAAASSQKLPLYLYIKELLKNTGLAVEIKKIPGPIFNVINGGKHGAGNLDFQEFHLIPASSKSYKEALKIGVEVYHKIKEVLINKNAIHSVGDEGGFAPDLYTNLDALEIIMQAVKESPYRFGDAIFLGLDLAAGHFLKNHHYKIRDKQQALNSQQFVNYLLELNSQYHPLMLEDPLGDDDWLGWQNLVKKIGSEVIIIGDDLLATNPKRLKRAIAEKACGGILIKPNQIGTVTETLEVVKIAKENDFKIVVSHRSGETNDTFIADFAVGVQSDYVKFGAPARGERVVKYNRLLEIEEELNL